MKTEVLARDSLQTKTNQMFTVLYDLLVFAIIPIAFEMSFVKIFQRSMDAYSTNDVEGLSRLTVYFIIQWFLGVLVRKQYLKASLKRLTLALLILIQVKEAFIEEVFFDMVVSMVMESGLMVLLFFKFANLMVLLKMVGISYVMLGTLLAMLANKTFLSERLNGGIRYTRTMVIYFMNRIHQQMMSYSWSRLNCC